MKKYYINYGSSHMPETDVSLVMIKYFDNNSLYPDRAQSNALHIIQVGMGRCATCHHGWLNMAKNTAYVNGILFVGGLSHSLRPREHF